MKHLQYEQIYSKPIIKYQQQSDICNNFLFYFPETDMKISTE